MDGLLYALLKKRISDVSYDDSELRQKLLKVIDDVNIINGNGEGSISKTIADEIAKVIADAPESFDTLKELSDWINTHSESASEMNSKIQKNASEIEKKLDKNQGVENSGKIMGIDESGSVIPISLMYIEYNKDTNCLEYKSNE